MIAIIPARGGSKGLPGKNIKELNGKPLISYTIEAALNSKYISRVVVTTDSEKIANVAMQSGAEIPFLRPDYLSSDTASAIDVYLHATEFLKNNYSEVVDKFMVLLPTAPMRKTKHIDEAVTKFYAERADTLISVKEAETPVTWYMNKSNNDRITNAGFGVGNAVTNRQVNTVYYIPNGAIYILDYQLLKTQRTYYSNNTIAYVMSAEDSVDIDTLTEFKFAEFLMQQK